MNRRSFIAALAGGVAWPIAVSAQEPGRTYRLGFLLPFGRGALGIAEYFDELRLNGFIEGQNLTIAPVGFGIRNEQLAEAAAALASSAPDVIFTGPDAYTRATQENVRAIPIVALSGDLVGAGPVASLARPGGNTTGISMFAPELDGKRQDILMEAAPTARRMAAVVDTTMSQNTPQHVRDLQDAARARGVELSIFAVSKIEDVVPAINAAKASGIEALNFLATPMFITNRRVILDRVAAVRLPAMYQWPEMAEDGGLVAYGSRLPQIYRQVARLVVKVLRGAKPADLPIEQPTSFELIINLKAAKAIGYEVPAGLLLRADKLIE